MKYDGHDVESVHIFASDSGRTCKSHLLKGIYNAISERLLYHWKDPEKTRVLLLEHTGILIENIGFIIHPGLAIKPGTKLLGLNHKSRAALRNRPSEVIFLAIDVLFMISSDLWTDIDPRLGAIFMMIPQKTFAFAGIINYRLNVITIWGWKLTVIHYFSFDKAPSVTIQETEF